MPNTLNPPVMLDRAMIEQAVESSKQRAESARSTAAGSTISNSSNTENAGMYRTHNRKKVTAAPVAKGGVSDATGEWKK